ncbi:hypothetical protein [Devosia ginsengisoli]|uniref:hypothetical protein n=1 Tax=Devosia ginsengisoli TaxID=400770 RepID=UPI0026EB68BC|nr:hypothetical protein [Devosia ginsengisoli]MCR6672204.1 hypothetical protein [Devosia ginsengisoli]
MSTIIATVHTIKALAEEGSFDIDLTVEDLGRINYTYLPGDDAPVAVALTAWLAANPSFPVELYEPPPEPPVVLPTLKPYQFWGAVRAQGYEVTLHDWVASITDPVEQALASSMLEFSLEFRRNHPMIEAARVYLEMSESDLDNLWSWAATL